MFLRVCQVAFGAIILLIIVLFSILFGTLKLTDNTYVFFDTSASNHAFIYFQDGISNVIYILGYSSLLISLFFVVFSIKLILRIPNKNFIGRFILLFPLLISGSLLFSSWNMHRDTWETGLGGILGDYLKDIFLRYLDAFSVYLFSWVSFSILLFFSIGLSCKEWKLCVFKICQVFKTVLQKIWHKLNHLSHQKAQNEKVLEVSKKEISKSVIANTHKNKDNILPSVELLKIGVKKDDKEIAEIKNKSIEKKEQLQQTLMDYGVQAEIIDHSIGPVVTLYEIEPAPGTKAFRIISLSDDIARSISAISTRISVVPGKNVLGIEIPNDKREVIYLRKLIESKEYQNHNCLLPLVLGENISGNPVIADLAKMPHLLVAGTTGSGKSVAINTMILSILYSCSAKNCRFVMIDPKMLELSVYEGIPHLLSPVVTDPKKAVEALKWVVREMEQRYRAMASFGVRNISGFNNLINEALAKGEVLERSIHIGFDDETGDAQYQQMTITEPLPCIVVIVDEMADLMLVAGKEIEGYIQRIAQMARASGIHLIMATQRPSVDVITGVIKANFPTRISFHVTSKIDSRTILGEQGAEQLLGMGDMLYMSTGGNIQRVHAPFVSDDEVEKVVNELKNHEKPEYNLDFNSLKVTEDKGGGIDHNACVMDSEDSLFKKAVEIVIADNRPTTSYVQRRLKIGYNKAASLIEQMEQEGIVSAPNFQGKREVLKNQ